MMPAVPDFWQGVLWALAYAYGGWLLLVITTSKERRQDLLTLGLVIAWPLFLAMVVVDNLMPRFTGWLRRRRNRARW